MSSYARLSWKPMIELKVRYLSYLCSHITYSAGYLGYRRLFYWVCELDIFISQTFNQLHSLYFNMHFNISEMNKGQKSLICDGYVFRVDNVLKSGYISWRCSNKKCKGRVRTDSSISTIVPINMDHTHDRNDKKKWRGNSCAFKSNVRRLMIWRLGLPRV